MGDGYNVMDKYLDGHDPTKKIDRKNSKSNVNTLSAAKLSQASLKMETPHNYGPAPERSESGLGGGLASKARELRWVPNQRSRGSSSPP
jgi:hypothetical protein